jgi:hypothetical protein
MKHRVEYKKIGEITVAWLDRMADEGWEVIGFISLVGTALGSVKVVMVRDEQAELAFPVAGHV